MTLKSDEELKQLVFMIIFKIVSFYQPVNRQQLSKMVVFLDQTKAMTPFIQSRTGNVQIDRCHYVRLPWCFYQQCITSPYIIKVQGYLPGRIWYKQHKTQNFNYPFLCYGQDFIFQPSMFISTHNSGQACEVNEQVQTLSLNREFEPVKKEEEEGKPYQTFPQDKGPSSYPLVRPTEQNYSNKVGVKSCKKKKEVDSFTSRRNIIPNNVNHILSYIQRKNKSESVVEKIMEKIGGGAQYNSKTFYSYQIYLKGHLHVHVNKDTLKEIVSHVDPESSIYEVEEQMFYNKVCRILIGYYIRELAKLKILNSTRVKSTSKLDHLNAHRTLLDCLIGNNS